MDDWKIDYLRRFTWLRSLNYHARNLEGCKGYNVKIMQVLRLGHENVPLKHYTFQRTLKK